MTIASLLWMIIRSLLLSLIIIRSQVLVNREYLISMQAADRLLRFISEILRTAPWHILVMAACPRGHIAACELQQELLIVCDY